MKGLIFLLLLALFSINGFAQDLPKGPFPGKAPERPKPSDWENPTGPYKVIMDVDETLPEHTIYRPDDLSKFPKKDKLPVVIMSGPGCDFDGDSYRPFWTEIASYGYLVIAIGLPVPEGTRAKMFFNTSEDLVEGLDWVFAENNRKNGKYYGKIDTEHVALYGQSCGGVQALRIADDPRIKTLAFWNSGSILMGNVGPTDGTKWLDSDIDLMGNRDLKELVKSLDIPIAYFIGDTDMAQKSASGDFSDLEDISVFYAVRQIPGDSHGGTFREKNGGAFGVAGVAWLQWLFKQDKKAAKMFRGNPCELEKDPKWIEVKKKNI